jgi:DedD protein
MFWRRNRTASPHDEPAAGARAPVLSEHDLERMRVAARRRLIGAAVLVLLTVLIFPWVFERQPKPIDDDLIIEVPRKDLPKPPGGVAAPSPAEQPASAAPAAVDAPVAPVAGASAASAPRATELHTPVSAPGAAAAASKATPAAAPPAASKPAAAAEAAAQPAASKPAAAASASAPPKPVAAEPPKPAAAPASAPPKPVAAEPPKPAPAAAGAAAAKAAPRYLVQVAAFAEADKARETRLKLVAEGYKAFSTPVETPKGKVWRVRVGPLESRAQAEQLKAKLLLLGFNPAIVEQ